MFSSYMLCVKKNTSITLDAFKHTILSWKQVIDINLAKYGLLGNLHKCVTNASVVGFELQGFWMFL